ncbi:MAG: hypothetical protein QMD46_12255 [Methanomicrobiales archaeon]|nr:hypothetical protein [Methanomicrobiales archaeon]
MTILVPPRLVPGIDCAVEGFALSGTISGTRQVMTVTIDTPAAASDTVEFTVTLDAAPGAGVSDEVLFYGGLIGVPAR